MLSRLHRSGHDRGAVAILVVLLVCLVAVPASALGLTTYVRSSALAELQQAADAAALAGASTIPLADLDYALEYSGVDASLTGTLEGSDRLLGRVDARLERVERRTDQDLPQLQGSLPGNPLQTVVIEPLANACATAVQAGSSMSYGGTWTFPRLNPVVVPGGRVCDGASTAGAVAGVPAFAGAKYYRDTSVVGAIGSCVFQTRARLTPVLAQLPPEVRERLALLEGTLRGLAGVLPALLRPGVIVEMRQSVQGPLDELLSAQAGRTEQVVTARARRRPKNLVVVPYDQRLALDLTAAADDTTDAVKDALLGTSALLVQLDQLLGGTVTVPPLSGTPLPETGTGLDPALGGLLGTVDDTLPDDVALPDLPLAECAQIINAAVQDYDDLIAPADTAPVQDILRNAAAGDEPVVVAVTGPNSTFLDTVPVCLDQPVTPRLADPLPDADGDQLPDALVVGGRVDIQVDPENVVSGLVCAPGTPGAFRASLVR